jgi:cytochrome c peroxidase
MTSLLLHHRPQPFQRLVPPRRDAIEDAAHIFELARAQFPDVVDHYDRAPPAPDGHAELKPLRFEKRALQQLVAFLRTLCGGANAPAELLRP